jgi:hypothetical protein
MIVPTAIRLVPTVSIVPPNLEAWLNGSSCSPMAAPTPVSMPTQALPPRLSVCSSHASDCHLPSQRCGDRPACLIAPIEPLVGCELPPAPPPTPPPAFLPSPLLMAAPASPDAEPPQTDPPTPKPPKSQSWEDIQELPPTFKLSLIPLHELVEPRAVLSAVVGFEAAKAQLDAEKEQRRKVVEELRSMGIAA